MRQHPDLPPAGSTLQFVGAWADRAVACPADADLRVSPAAVAWRVAAKCAEVLFEVLEADKRPTAAVADFTEVRDVISVEVSEHRSVSIAVLFDPDRGLSERIIAEQFTV
jgi:hypothetical protein